MYHAAFLQEGLTPVIHCRLPQVLLSRPCAIDVSGQTTTKPSPRCLQSIGKYESANSARRLMLGSCDRAREVTSLLKPTMSIIGISRQICLKFRRALLSIRFSISFLKSPFSTSDKDSFFIFWRRPSIAYPDLK